ncbi:MAG: metallophosphatase [Deltaproteobacteria bacterium RBG_19FT_COMBO_43_11]|nr:MAG: metallophosphatase [Deltaproteobacteria bacterium RBG_19FT_COMBO_43_11]
MNRIFAIGDIHGCLEKLEDLIEVITANPKKDKLIFIGDYIDRGSFSREVVEHVIGLKNKFKNVICLLGNHEQMFLNYLEGVDEEMYLYNGGKPTLSGYGIKSSDPPDERKKKMPKTHLFFYRSLLPYYQTKDYLFIHAGLIPAVPLKKQTTYDLLWIRHEFIDSDYDFGKRVIFGHTPLSRPLVMENKIGIDTGAVYGGKLTCVELPALNIYQV